MFLGICKLKCVAHLPTVAYDDSPELAAEGAPVTFVIELSAPSAPV